MDTTYAKRSSECTSCSTSYFPCPAIQDGFRARRDIEEEEEHDWNALIETEEWDINSQLCEVDEMIAQGGCKLSEELDKFLGQIITENFPISDEQLVKLPVVQEFLPLVNELER